MSLSCLIQSITTSDDRTFIKAGIWDNLHLEATPTPPSCGFSSFDTERAKATFNPRSCVEIRDLLEFTKNRALIEDFPLSLQFNMVINLTKAYLNGN